MKGLELTLSKTSIAIVGMGLMGGSLGKALVKHRACREVRALVRRPMAARQAVASGAAHIAGTDPQQILADAHIVVFATPVRTIEKQIGSLKGFLKPGAVVTDLGSVKKGVASVMEDLPDGIFAVGGHPMCGKESSGLAEADPDLFAGKVWVLVPLKNSNTGAMKLINELVSVVGARSVKMNAPEHDEVVACISHLPYLLATTLVSVAEETSKDQPSIWNLASSGFRDTSRVAAGDLSMMMDIMAANRANITRSVEKALRHLEVVRQSLVSGDEKILRDLCSDARDRRLQLFKDHDGVGAGKVSHA
ncbi:MAG: prephenate dehydrogenase/arogenate dehydrogenase family protein [Desulfomonile tiedjei]|nr:prephenate dehydrogenase/arogenate dehydrogenase family protein [Desulfomonile tiedjei]